MAEGSGKERSVACVSCMSWEWTVSGPDCCHHGGWCLRDTTAMPAFKERKILQVKTEWIFRNQSFLVTFLCSRQSLGTGVMWVILVMPFLRDHWKGMEWLVVVTAGWVAEEYRMNLEPQQHTRIILRGWQAMWSCLETKVEKLETEYTKEVYVHTYKESWEIQRCEALGWPKYYWEDK